MKRAFVVAYKTFAEAYRSANELLRDGLDGFVVFPEGGHSLLKIGLGAYLAEVGNAVMVSREGCSLCFLTRPGYELAP